MFEHLGFKDFCIGLWKYKYLIIAVTLVVTLVFGALVGGKTIVGEEEPYYINEKIVCFKNDDIPKDTTAGYTVNKLAEMYKDLLSQEAVTTYVIEKTEDSYSEDFIEELYTKTFGSSVLQDGKISPKQFAKFTTVSFAAGNVGVKIHVETKDRAFSDNLMKIYTDYINGSVKDIGDKITVDCISELVSEKAEPTESSLSSFSESKTVKIALIAVLAFVLTCFGVFIKILVKPTLNRRADFENMGIPVLGEFKK